MICIKKKTIMIVFFNDYYYDYDRYDYNKNDYLVDYRSFDYESEYFGRYRH